MTNYVSLGEIVDIKGGGTPDKKVAAFWDGDIPWASVKDFKSGVLDRTVDRITAAGVAASATNIIPSGHIIVPTRMAVGEDVTEELEYVPGRFIVNRIVRPRFACSGCEGFTQAALP